MLMFIGVIYFCLFGVFQPTREVFPHTEMSALATPTVNRTSACMVWSIPYTCDSHTCAAFSKASARERSPTEQ